jgi:hypothetical protein
MESNDYRINTEKIETKPPTTGKSKKVKKKSAIAKLTEKRRASESGSEFGSTVSLRYLPLLNLKFLYPCYHCLHPI